MSMFTVSGQVVNIFKTPQGTNREGESYGGDYKVQILGEIPLPNGETRHEMIDLKVQDTEIYKPYLGKRLTVPVGSLALAKNKIVHFIPKGAQPLTGA